MSPLSALASFLLPASAAGTLAWLARGQEGRWALVTALALGPAEVSPSGERGCDLRFASACAAVACELGALGLGLLPALPPATLIGAFLLGTPLVALGLAAAGDLLRGGGEGLDPALVEGLLDQAEHELREARVRVQSEQRIALLDTLGEACEDYRQALSEGATHALRERVEGVIALTRSCLSEEGLAAARCLGLSPDASPAEAREVFQALTRIYGGPTPLAGVDPHKHSELRDAYERFQARAALQSAEPPGSATQEAPERAPELRRAA